MLLVCSSELRAHKDLGLLGIYESSILQLEIQTFDFRVNPEALQLADALSTTRTARPRQVSADRTVFMRRVAWPAHFDVTKVRLSLFLQTLLLYYFA